MKRLTDKDLKELRCRDCCHQGHCHSETDCISVLEERLAMIEDIIGDDYDLKRLKELVDADKENRLDIFSNEESIVRIFCPKDEDGLYIKQVAGVISEKEYMAEHGRRAEVR